MTPSVQIPTRVVGGDNTGDAAILDVHGDFNPAPYQAQQLQIVQNQINKKAAEDAARVLALRDKEKQDALNWKPVLETLGKNPFGPRFQKEQAITIDRQAKEFARMRNEGQNPMDIATEAGQAWINAQKENEAKAAMGKAVDERMKALLEKVGDPKYNQQKLQSYIEEWNKIPDGEGGIKQAYDYMTDPTKRPLVVDVDIEGLYKKLTPEYGDNGYVQSIDPNAVKESATLHFATPQGTEELESLIEMGYGKDSKEVIETLAAEVKRRNPDKKDRPRTTSDSDTEGGGKYDIVATPSHNPNFTGEAGKTNVITYTPKGQNFKPITFYDEAKPYTASTFTIHPDTRTDAKGNQVTGFVVEAEVLPDPPTDVPKLREGASEKDKEVYRAAKSKYDAANDLYESGRKVKKKFWVSNVPGANGNDNYNTITSRTGTPPEQMLGIPVVQQTLSDGTVVNSSGSKKKKYNPKTGKFE